jgi:hypothetical protein
MRRSACWFILVLALSVSLLGETGSSGASTDWIVAVNSGNSGQAQAFNLPPAPVATATCSSLVLGSVVITWSAVTPSSSYTVYESTTSATGTYSVIASGVTGLTYTQSGLLGNYWFKVSASVGSFWAGPKSAATNERSITLVLCS